ncbi:3-dehydroquinate synthase [Puia dinghuensis]|uniref:3-dehydroquinate synthase n=1 Tax=Puia dinghuensis TaxID=1792502 RepID=A0A8J2XS16_9BACT|nr:3-dehydroquinate synthase [Puia dinghuensis]GGA91506.1 3-dehydroquinate synthase [Puia dinghuensis]
MNKLQYTFSGKTTTWYLDADFGYLAKLVDKDHTVLITDEHLFAAHQKRFGGWSTIVINAGEQYKVQATVDSIIEQLIELGADRKTTLIGVGGGVVTDITGYVAAIYMRGLAFGFVPTSLLAMVDASVGGKNGIDVGVYKNMVGTIRQPQFLLYDYAMLKSLPKEEWVNGFAEIIKHAAIKDAALFRELEKNKLTTYQKDKAALAKLIKRNVGIKAKVVEKDEFERGDRRLLNFGHTLGHAIENLYELSHGQAISIGMVAASMISEEFTDFKETDRVIGALKRYGLPTLAAFNAKEVINVLRMDKKKVKESMNYVLLNKIGQGVVRTIPLAELEKLVQSIITAR